MSRKNRETKVGMKAGEKELNEVKIPFTTFSGRLDVVFLPKFLLAVQVVVAHLLSDLGYVRQLIVTDIQPVP